MPQKTTGRDRISEVIAQLPPLPYGAKKTNRISEVIAQLPPLPYGAKKAKARRTTAKKAKRHTPKHIRLVDETQEKPKARKPHKSSCSQGRGDEFYTRPEDVANILEQYLPELRGKRILVPCGGDDDPWASYLRKNGVKDITTDPDLCYQSFDFSEYDYVISNPPFSLTKDFLSRIDEAGCGGLVIIQDVSLSNTASLSLLSKGWRAYDEGAPRVFNRPGGTQRKVNTVFITSFQTNVHEGEKRRITGHKPPVMTDQGIPSYKRTADVPEHWSGVIAVPVGFAPIRLDHDLHTLSPKQVNLSANGKDIFARLLVSCDGSTVVKEGKRLVRRTVRGNRATLTPASTALLAAA